MKSAKGNIGGTQIKTRAFQKVGNNEPATSMTKPKGSGMSNHLVSSRDESCGLPSKLGGGGRTKDAC